MRFGVDEAGKGPVLGSMFAAAVVVRDPDGVYATGDATSDGLDPTAVLPAEVDDSKNLAPAVRERLDATIRDDDRVDVALAEITPARIDDPATDMNSLCVAAHAQALSAVADDGDSGVVDAGDTDAARFGRRVTERATVDVDVTAEHGADETHAVAAAASVVAKVARDAHVDALADEHGPIGSGYPSDPTTRAFLADYVDRHGDLPPFARASWSTCDDVLAAAEQAGLDDF